MPSGGTWFVTDDPAFEVVTFGVSTDEPEVVPPLPSRRAQAQALNRLIDESPLGQQLQGTSMPRQGYELTAEGYRRAWDDGMEHVFSRRDRRTLHRMYNVPMREPMIEAIRQGRLDRERAEVFIKRRNRKIPANSKRDHVLKKFIDSKTDWTVAELARTLGMTKLTARKHVKSLHADGIVVKVGMTKGGVGRPAALYMLAD